MCKQLSVTSNYPNIRGNYSEWCVHEDRPAFLRDSTPSTWIFYSSKFGNGPTWYFADSLPGKGSMSSLTRSLDDAATPEEAHWPSSDITEIKEHSSMELVADPIPEKCSSCALLDGLVQGLQCPLCAPSVDSRALQGLILFQDCVDSSTLQRLAVALVNGNDEIKVKLEQIFVAHDCQTIQPVIIVEPPSCLEVGSGATNLVCHAFCVGSPTLSYQWCKNGVPLSRAVRPRLVLCGCTSQDEGFYVCQVSVGDVSVSTQACQIKLARDETSNASSLESILCRAAEAQQCNQLNTALELLAEAIQITVRDEGAQAKAFCRRAELFVKMDRLQEAFLDSTSAVRISPDYAHAHAVRGRIASKLNLLAEAVSSWETADVLGGISEAAREAQLCRERLEEFFAERRKINGYKNGAESNGQRSTWQNAYGSFSGKGGRSCNEKGSIGSNSKLQGHLSVLGLACDGRGALPAREVVCTAYRRLALQLHPDKPGGSKTAFQELQAAYEAVLKEILS